MPTGAALGAVQLWKSHNRLELGPAKKKDFWWLQHDRL